MAYENFKEFVEMGKDFKEYVNAYALEQYFYRGNIKQHKIYEGTSFANYAFSVDSVCHTVRNFPRADVVEVVRCKDCKHYDNGYCYSYGLATDRRFVRSYDFCSYGARKEVEE